MRTLLRVMPVVLPIFAVLFSSLAVLPPRRVYAQEAAECSEEHLRNLGVAIVSCTDVSSTTSCGGSNLIGGDNPEKVWNYLIGKGLTSLQAAGAMGNLQHEGGFNPKRVEGGTWGGQTFGGESDTITPNVGPAGQPGYGIVQWTSPGRKQGLVDFAASKNLPVSDLGVQLDYMWSELEGPYKNAALDPLRAATDLSAAVSIWQDHYEVGSNFQPRFEAAQTWLAEFGSGAASANNGSGCQLDASGCPTEPVSQSDTVLAAGIRVHSCIAAEVERIVALAKEQGLSTFSGWGWVSKEEQEQKRANNGCAGREYDEACNGSPTTAIPGKSRHEYGTAVDFTCDGDIFTSHSHACFKFLEANTKLRNLPSEPWHWSIDGG